VLSPPIVDRGNKVSSAPDGEAALP
jgi:hypothetical protein